MLRAMAEQTTNRARPEEADKDAAQLTPDEVTTLVNFAELIRTAEAKAAKHQAPARPGFGLVVAVCVAVCVGIMIGVMIGALGGLALSSWIGVEIISRIMNSNPEEAD